MTGNRYSVGRIATRQLARHCWKLQWTVLYVGWKKLYVEPHQRIRSLYCFYWELSWQNTFYIFFVNLYVFFWTLKSLNICLVYWKSLNNQIHCWWHWLDFFSVWFGMLGIQNIAKTSDSILLYLDLGCVDQQTSQNSLDTSSFAGHLWSILSINSRKFERTRRTNTETSSLPPKKTNTLFFRQWEKENQTFCHRRQTKRKTSGTTTETKLEIKPRCHWSLSTSRASRLEK